ncbi:MAG: sensor histidine kinase [Acidimicrobiales bacterium]
MPTSVTVLGEARGLPPTVDLAGYRIVQESLTNALRHAGPAQTSVRLSYEGSLLVIEVSDDGRGTLAGPGRFSEGAGHGITGMRERAAAVGGTLEAGPGEGGGWLVRASLPLSVRPSDSPAGDAGSAGSAGPADGAAGPAGSAGSTGPAGSAGPAGGAGSDDRTDRSAGRPTRAARVR